VVTFIDYEHIPRLGAEYPLKVATVHRPVDTGDDQRVGQLSAVLGRRPPAEVEAQSVELAPHVRDKPGRREVKHTQPGRLVEQVLDQQAGLNCLAESDFVGHKDPPQGVGLEHMVHQAHLVGKGVHRSGVEPAERILAHQVVSPQPGETAPGLGRPVVLAR
jgi:hypothetical protein